MTMIERPSFRSLARLEEEPAPSLRRKRADDVKRTYKNSAGTKKRSGTGRPRESAEGAHRRSVSLPRALWRQIFLRISETNETISAFVRRACKRELRAPKLKKDHFPMRFK